MENEILSLLNVKKNFVKAEVLKGVSFSLKAKEQRVIRGASGSGKSTLLYLIGGLEPADDGSIFWDNRNLSKMDEEALAQFRNETVGFVFQHHFLLPSMNCLDNILLKARIGNKGGAYLKKIKTEALDMAKYMGVEHCLKKYPYEISGGEQQRVNLLRALSTAPSLLLCDEPTGNLDSVNTHKVVLLIKEMASQYGSTLLIVTHEDEVAKHFSEQLILKDGVI